VIEAMKMEHAVATPIAGRVSRVLVREGQQVQRATCWPRCRRRHSAAAGIIG